MKKILYFITSLAHKRVFESFEERTDAQQAVLGPNPQITGAGIVPENYNDFKLKNVNFYKNYTDINNFVKKFKPDVLAQASLPVAQNITLPASTKKVYVSHGMVGGHVSGIIKKAGLKTRVWKGCDLYCGATNIFADWVKTAAKVGDEKILTNALPQLDIIHDKNYYESYRERVLKQTNNTRAKKVILFIGFCCKDRYDFVYHNEDYFRAVLSLEKAARQNNWLIMVKPRHTYKNMIKFLRTHRWGIKYIDKYQALQNSKHLHFITTTGHIYRYFFADAFVINGTSTVEIEACAINKPLFVVQTEYQHAIDPYGAKASGASFGISDVDELQNYLERCMRDGSYHNAEAQNKLIKSLGIKFDGMMHKRVQDKLIEL
jgi:hypothetical protein